MNFVLRKTVCGVFLAALIAIIPFAASAVEHQVIVDGSTFVPASIIVNQGDTVRWTNNTRGKHTTTSGTGCTSNGIWNLALNANTSVVFAFNAAGVYPYFCVFHCSSGMTGLVTVNAQVPVRQSTWGAIKALYAVH